MAALTVASAACRDEPVAPGEAQAVAASASAGAEARPKLAVGDKVVAATSGVAFKAGEVVRFEGDSVVFAYGSAGADGERPLQTAARAGVWPLGYQGALVKAGEHAVCKLGVGLWVACRIHHAGGAQLDVEDAAGTRSRVGAVAITRPDAATRARIGAYLAREKIHREFDDAFRAAGRPQPPADWRPRAGDAVVIHFVDTSYYGGKVVEAKLERRKVRVAWDGGSWDDRDVPLDDVVPRPTKASPPSVGQFVLGPPSGTPPRWRAYRVTRVGGSQVTATDRDGNPQTLDAATLVPLTPAASEAP
jgi:hypothetical protein